MRIRAPPRWRCRRGGEARGPYCHTSYTTTSPRVRLTRQALCGGRAAHPEGPGLMESPALIDLVLITGFSGAGKSTAMAAFEDAGYFCVDNLPPEMIRSLVDLFMHEGSNVARAAVVSDARTGDYFEGLVQMLEDLRTAGIRHRVLF